MTDKTDPRLDAAKGWAAEDWEQELRNEGITFDDDALTERAQDMLADLDDADRAAGIVRVDTNDEALRDRLVAIIEASECVEKPAHDNTDGWGLCAICEANAILAALREAS